MALSCQLHVRRGVSPESYLRSVAGLYDAVDARGAEPQLGIFELTGDALLLGRHQRLVSAVDTHAARARGLPLLRRHTGGRTVRVGDGVVAVLVALPHPSALMPSPIPLSKVLNRYVRGVLAMGMQLKAPTYYFARDFVSLQSKQAGYLSLDARPTGATIVECLLAVNRSTAVPPELIAYPPREDGLEPPASTSYADVVGHALSFDEVQAALVKGYGRSYGLELKPQEGIVAGELLPVEEDENGFESSGVGEIAIGFLEALVKREGDRLGTARLRGDFICPAEAIRRVERAVQGQPVTYVDVGREVDAVFKDPYATLMGVKHLRIIPDAFLAAAGAT